MSQTEEQSLTLTRLLERYVRVVKEDGSVARVHVTREWHDRELLKNYDAQVTVGFDRNEEHRLSLDGDLRRKQGFARVSVWTADKPDQGTVGRDMRDKTVSEVSRVIREKRNRPSTVDYNFAGVGSQTQTHKAWQAASAVELSPSDAAWTELSDLEYQKIWYSDDDRFSTSTLDSGKRAMMLFRFEVDADPEAIKELSLKFEGYGTAPAGNGVTIEVWNHVVGAWQHSVSGTGGGDELLTIDLTSNLSGYVDSDGYVYLLAEALNPSDGVQASVLYCDCPGTVFTVNGVTYADVVSVQNADEVRVKPFLWHTVFTVKTWQFENVSAT